MSIGAARNNHTELVSNRILNETEKINGIFSVRKLREVLFEDFAGVLIPGKKTRGRSENMNCIINTTRNVMSHFISVNINEARDILARADEKPDAAMEIHEKSLQLVQSRPDILSLMKTWRELKKFKEVVELMKVK